MPNVVVIPWQYPDPRDPLQFQGNWIVEQAQALSDKNCITVVYPLIAVSKQGSIEDLTFNGVPTIRVHYRHIRKTWLLSYVLAAWKGVQKALARHKIECIHSHGLYDSGLAAVLIGQLLRVPVVVTEHWGQLRERTRESRAAGAVIRFVLRRAVRTVAVSDFLAEEIREIEPRASVVVVPNIVSPLFHVDRTPPALSPTGTAEILFVGSLNDNRKGLDFLLQGLSRYRSRPGGLLFRLRVIGDGIERSCFEELAASLGLESICEFAGFRSREEVAAAMQRCTVFAMPSRYETFGVVYVEAMACGKPVIACSGGPAEQIVPPWAGAFAVHGDVDGLADSIHRTLGNLSSFDPESISAYAHSQFGADAVCHAMSRVYLDAVQGSRTLTPNRE
jgi:L-malate glycosyltransferase